MIIQQASAQKFVVLFFFAFKANILSRIKRAILFDKSKIALKKKILQKLMYESSKNASYDDDWCVDASQLVLGFVFNIITF